MLTKYLLKINKLFLIRYPTSTKAQLETDSEYILGVNLKQPQGPQRRALK